MIVLDTNILSETLRDAMDGCVARWFEAQPDEALFTTSVTKAEIAYGVGLLPDGARRVSLEAAVAGLFGDLAGRILPFDEAAAEHYAAIMVSQRVSGLPIAALDCQIAAICRSRGARLATRNIRDFVEIGLDLIDPFAFAH